MAVVSTTYKCDNCGKLREEVDVMLPADWVVVQQGSMRSMTCSWECAFSFAQTVKGNPARVSANAKPAPAPTKQLTPTELPAKEAPK